MKTVIEFEDSVPNDVREFAKSVNWSVPYVKVRANRGKWEDLRTDMSSDVSYPLEARTNPKDREDSEFSFLYGIVRLDGKWCIVQLVIF